MTNAIETAIIALIHQHAKPEIDYAILADRLHEVCLSSLANEIDLNALSEHIAIPDADSIKDVVMRDIEAKLAEMSQRIAELESWRRVHMTLAQQPQPQPSTPEVRQ